MTGTPTTGRPRKGFTLIELLVIIAIISVLAGMLLVAIQKVRESGPRLQARRDLSQLEVAITNFMQDRKVDYIPSMLVIDETGNYTPPAGASLAVSQLYNDSKAFMKKVFPNHRAKDPKTGAFWLDWNGNGVLGELPDPVNPALDMNQCLVFLLGGIHGTQGFSSNPYNPTDNRSERIGAFFNFEVKRLRQFNDPTQPFTSGGLGKAGYPVFVDPWEEPYAYFSSYKGENGYNRYGQERFTLPNGTYVEPYIRTMGTPGTPATATTPAIPGTPTIYWNPKGYQIISAGLNRKFGSGGLWGTGIPVPLEGQDDFANFHSTRLGIP